METKTEETTRGLRGRATDRTWGEHGVDEVAAPCCSVAVRPNEGAGALELLLQCTHREHAGKITCQAHGPGLILTIFPCGSLNTVDMS